MIEVKREYYPAGELLSETPYLNGKRRGTRKVYYEDGKLYSETPYLNGQFHGVYRAYYEGGELWYENHHLYGRGVTKEEYRKHELIEELAKI